MKTKYPELEKLQEVKEKSQDLGEFLEWLKSQYTLCIWFRENNNSPKELFPEYKSIEQILADYFHIDLDKVEKEKQQILKELRETMK